MLGGSKTTNQFASTADSGAVEGQLVMDAFSCANVFNFLMPTDVRRSGITAVSASEGEIEKKGFRFVGLSLAFLTVYSCSGFEALGSTQFDEV